MLRAPGWSLPQSTSRKTTLRPGSTSPDAGRQNDPMSRMDYKVDGRQACLYDCGDEFLRFELYEGFLSMGWSCGCRSAPSSTV